MPGILDDQGERGDTRGRTADPHPCPYLVDIEGDSDTLCTCGERKMDECEADI